jgi:RNA polymerase sigma-70 factor (ECF subfamily)
MTMDRVTPRREFEKLLEPVLEGAYRTAFQMTRNAEEAKDLVQDAVVLAFRAFDRFERASNFKAWLYRIMINRYRNILRSRRRQPEIAEVEDAEDLYLYNQSEQAGLYRETNDPAKLVIGKISEERIRSAITDLPVEFQEAALLYFTEELSYEEIAETLECPIGTVRSRLHRGRKILQKALWDLACEEGIETAKGES